MSRSGLIEAARASGCRVVGVTAPAGYGKSTLLTEWAVVEDRPVAWVSLDRFDDDPTALLTLLASAYVRITSETAPLVADMVGTAALGRAAPRLASVFRASPEPFVLVLDDLHELRAPSCHDVLDVVISGIPPGSQMVAASRFEQPHLPRLRATGDAIELVASDLALDVAGAEQIFSQANISLTHEVATALTERTEGWPVGLYLAAVIADEGADDAVAISGNDRYVADYLYRESLLQLPEATQHFLRRTAVLEQLCAPLCDAVVGGSGAQGELRTLEASSLFLIPLDRRREWFRYHALFREFLLGELRRVEPDVVAELHLRAANWCEANGSPTMAIEHLLQTTEQERCVELVATLTMSTFEAGQRSTIQRWLGELGNAAIEEHPSLAVWAGWITATTGQTAEALRWLAIVEAAPSDIVPLDGSASFDSGRAILRSGMCPDGPERALSDARVGVALEPLWSPWRGLALYLSGLARLLLGDVDGVGAVFAEASAASATASVPGDFALSEAELAFLAMESGRWAEAAEHVGRATAAVDEYRMHDYSVAALAFGAAARLAVHEGDLTKANRQLTRAMRARVNCTVALPGFAGRVRLHLAKVHQSIGDRTTARHLVREIDDILRHRPALGVFVDDVAECRRSLTASAQGPAGPSPLSPAELRLLPYLQTHLTVREIAERLFLSRNTIASEVSSIYRKLGVSSRNEAVEQATAIGLLGG